MMLILGMIVGAVVAFAAFCVGYGTGYTSGTSHGREAGEAAARARMAPSTDTRTSAQVARDFVLQLDRVRRSTLGLNARRADAQEIM